MKARWSIGNTVALVTNLQYYACNNLEGGRGAHQLYPPPAPPPTQNPYLISYNVRKPLF